LRFLNTILDKLGELYCNQKSKREYFNQRFEKINERVVEYSFAFKALASICPKSILDIGTGETALPVLMKNCGFLVTAADNIQDFWTKRIFNRHYYIINDDITNSKLRMKFDLITCISVIEHIRNFNDAVSGMFNLLNKNGHLVLTFPFNEYNYIENVYRLPDAGYGKDLPYICQVFSRNEINKWLKDNFIEIIEQEYWKIFTGKFWTFGKRIYPPLQVNKNQKHQLTCILIKKNENKD